MKKIILCFLCLSWWSCSARSPLLPPDIPPESQLEVRILEKEIQVKTWTPEEKASGLRILARGQNPQLRKVFTPFKIEIRRGPEVLVRLKTDGGHLVSTVDSDLFFTLDPSLAPWIKNEAPRGP